MTNELAEFSLRMALVGISTFLTIRYFELTGIWIFLSGYISSILINSVIEND